MMNEHSSNLAMTTETIEAWLLHKRASGDSSFYLSFFTREKGIVNCLWKGGRTLKKQAMLQPFSPLWLTLDTKRDIHYTRQVENVAGLLEFRKDSLFAAFYVNELLYCALRPLDPHPTLFDLYIQLFPRLAITTERLAIEALLRRFEWLLLSSCGAAVSFHEEARSRAPIEAGLCYQFIANEGFIAVPGAPITGWAILALAAGQLDDLMLLRTAKFIMRQAIDHLLNGQVLKSRSLIVREGKRI